jgi:hypothetical protein
MYKIFMPKQEMIIQLGIDHGQEINLCAAAEDVRDLYSALEPEIPSAHKKGAPKQDHPEILLAKCNLMLR